MTLRLFIAIVSIVQIFVSIISMFFISFFPNDSLNINPIYFTFTIFSWVLFFILFFLVLADSKKRGMFILALILVFFLYGFGALIYLFLTINLAKTDNITNKNKDKISFVDKMNLDSILNSSSYINVSNVDKEMIRNMYKPVNTTFKSSNFFKPLNKSKVAYYKNGKPVYENEIK